MDPLEEAERLIETAKRVSVDFLLTDAEVALTFVSIAETTSDPVVKERNIANALKAHDFIQSRRKDYILTDCENEHLDSVFAGLRVRLHALGSS